MATINKQDPNFKKLPIKPFSPNQLRALALSTAPFNLWDGSIRSGKTFLSILWLLRVNEECPPGDGMILGQTPETIERNFLNSLMSVLGEGNYHYRTGKSIDLYRWENGERITRRFYIVGARDVGALRRIRGSTLMIAYVDEGTLVPKVVFDELVGRLSSGQAKCLVTTNPDSPNHWLLTDYVENKTARADWRRFRFLLEDNLSLDDSYIERVKRQYSGIPARYARMIKGQWVLAEGVIYQKFKKDIHVVKKKDIPKSGLRRLFIGSDYGVGNPTAFLLIGEYYLNGKYVYYVLKEYYYSGRETGVNKTTREFGEDFIKFAKGNRIEEVVIDPSAAALITELETNEVKRGVGYFYNVVPADNAVLEGIQAVANMFADNVLFIVDTCINTIDELGLYSWDPKAQTNGIDKPLKINDHCLDALRYAIYTIIGKYGDISDASGW